MHISLIACLDIEGGIGNKGKLLYHLKEDMKFFKKMTMGKPVIMGKATYQSLPNRLHGRREIVISTELYASGAYIEGIEVYPSFKKAVEALKKEDIHEIMVIGGESLYHTTIAFASTLYITHVDHLSREKDRYFPFIKPKYWKLTKEDFYPKSPTQKYDFSIATYQRKKCLQFI